MRIHNVFHASLLKPFIRRPGEVIHPPSICVDDEEEYEVEALLARREKVVATSKKKHPAKGQPPSAAGQHTRKRIKVEYLVKWAGYGHEHNEWVKETELQRFCAQMIYNFNQAQEHMERANKL
jgi:Chromo (CHRromatin Organisation MOdifier) domain